MAPSSIPPIDASQKIFAEVHYSGHYDDVHSEMVTLMERSFSDIQSGHQGDSWIWITEGDDKVAIDTFSSNTHQVKSYVACPLVQKVVDALRLKYDVRLLDDPVEEWG